MVHVPGVQAQRSPRRPVASTRPSWSRLRSMSASTRRWRWCATSVASCWPPVGVPDDAGWGAAAGRPGPGSHPWTDGLAGPGRGGGGRAGPSAVDEHRCPARRLAADPDQPGPGGRQRQLRGRRRLKTDALDLAANSDLLGPGTALVIVSWPRRRGSWLGGWPESGGSRPGPRSRTSSWARSTGPSRSEWRCLEPVRHKVGRLVLAWVHRPGPAQRARVAGCQQVAATRGSRSWPGWPSGWWPPPPWPSRPTRPRWPGPSSTATAPAGRLRRPDRRGRQAPGRFVAADPVRGVVQRPGWRWSALPPLVPRSVTRHGGQRPPGGPSRRAVPRHRCLGRPPR